MDITDDIPFLLSVWTDEGTLVVSRPLDLRTWSFAAGSDSDVQLPMLGPDVVFLRLTTEGGTLFPHGVQAGEDRSELAPGIPLKLLGLTWLLTRPAAALTSELTGGDLPNGDLNIQTHAPTHSLYGDVLAGLVHWIARPMATAVELKTGLAEFLALLIGRTPAEGGMLVLAEGAGFGLVASHGLSPRDAQKLWEKMPHTLAEEILRTRARILLPEELKRSKVGSDSTVFVRGVRSMVGFPVLAEGRLVALFYLTFTNLLRHLSPELQNALEAAADLLGLVIQRALLREQLEALALKAAAGGPGTSLPSGRLMIGASTGLADVYRLIARLAPVDMPTLITGETGTGKELAAKELHRLSPRAQKPFVVVNAAALPESLIESELFGHKKGAFTGALTDRVGLVEQAAGGTLFLDEIGELPLTLQAKLLRVLQERVVTRIGDAAPRPVDFRLVTATHRPLEDMVRAGEFREDLYYRIAGAAVRMPALRERPEDIVTLANYFRQRFAERHGLTDKEWSTEALAALEGRAWSGNVRELENVVARAFVMAEGTVIRRRDLGLPEDQKASETSPDDALAETLIIARDAWMKGFLTRALRRHSGHRAETARALGIGERTLFRYLEQYEIKDA